MSPLTIVGYSLMALGFLGLVVQHVRLYRSKPETADVSMGFLVSTVVLFGIGAGLVIISAWFDGHPII